MAKEHCDCAAKVNEALKADGIELSLAMEYERDSKRGNVLRMVPHLAAKKTTRKGRLPVVTCSFCPFCGQKWTKESA